MTRTDLAAHLEFYRELGVDGVSRDPAWVRRAAGVPAAPPGTSADPEVAAAAPAGDDGLPAPLREPLDAADPGPALRANVLRGIRGDIGECTRCKLHRLGRTQIVFGVGNPHAEVMFAGEAPGRDEDAQGEPFVGRAGQLLTKIIEAMQMRREDVYIANVIKCRPPENRNPEPDEVAACQPFLFRQIDAIQPKVVVALGTFAAQTLLSTKDPISRLRGRVWTCRGAQLVATFHPAFLLRSPERKRDTWEDMKAVMAILRGERTGGPAA
jgi:DNA polymerase